MGNRFGRRAGGIAAAALAAALAGAAVAGAQETGLAGAQWRVVDIAGSGLPAGVTASLAFDADGRAGGSTGCNRLVTSYEHDGDRLVFGPAAATMMACPDPQMRTQARYIEAIEATRSFRIKDGRLVLLADDGRPLMTLAR